VDNLQESWQIYAQLGMEPNMEQRVREDPSYIARRLFTALCTLYPDRYIALIEQPPLSPELAAAQAHAASQKPHAL
jgi:hypothetical protein